MRALLTGALVTAMTAGAAAHELTSPALKTAQTETTSTSAFAEPAPPPPWHEVAAPPPKLVEGLGNTAYEIAATLDARRFFNQGLVWAYAFNQPEAFRNFRHAQTLDPKCAMCFWGEAYVLGPNLNIPMDARADAAARTAGERAVSLAASGKERAIAEAMLARYPTNGDRADGNKQYARAMVEVAQRFPDDSHLATLAAEALMLLSPWDYWLDKGRTPKPETSEAQALLEAALARNPDHIGAAHFYIHLVEASTKPERALPFADRLRTAAPAAGHLVHMPSHIYMRVGRLKDSLEDNHKAALADEEYLAGNKEVAGPYGLIYYPHNVHFKMISALMSGDRSTALGSAEKLMGLISAETALALPPVQPIQQAPYFVVAQLGTPGQVLSLPDPGSKLPFVRVAWHFARGTAYLTQSDLIEARREAAALRTLAQQSFEELESSAVPAQRIAAIARDVLYARIELASGDPAEARRHAEQALETERSLPYMEPAFWYMPVGHTLGAINLASDDTTAAISAFEDALHAMPNSVWALKGLEATYAAAGKPEKAADAKRRLEAVLPEGAPPPDWRKL